MRLLIMTLAVALLGAIPAKAVECELRNGLCGSTLIDAGWQVLAQCRGGHSWSYVVAKDDERLICTGLYAYHGPVEFPCRQFNGDLDRFRSIATKSRSERKRARTNCWSEAQQFVGAR
jgi:hypothetical protein